MFQTQRIKLLGTKTRACNTFYIFGKLMQPSGPTAIFYFIHKIYPSIWTLRKHLNCALKKNIRNKESQQSNHEESRIVTNAPPEAIDGHRGELARKVSKI